MGQWPVVVEASIVLDERYWNPTVLVDNCKDFAVSSFALFNLSQRHCGYVRRQGRVKSWLCPMISDTAHNVSDDVPGDAYARSMPV